VVFFLSVTDVLFITALVAVGIGALFQAMPPKYQPEVTSWFVNIGAFWLKYGPHPKDSEEVVCTLFSAILMLFACVPLFRALRSCGPRRLTVILLTPLILCALANMALCGWYGLGLPGIAIGDIRRQTTFFGAGTLADEMTGQARYAVFGLAGPSPVEKLAECLKWGIVVAIALWLTAAQVWTWKKGPATAVAPRQT
jgi:hypothetical protein